MSDWMWSGPFVRIPRSMQDDPIWHNDRALAKWLRELIEADRERRRRKGRRAYVKPSVWAEILKRFGHRCAYCGRDDLPLQKEHRVAIANGGPDIPSNLVPACGPCNRRKFIADPADWPLLTEPS